MPSHTTDKHKHGKAAVMLADRPFVVKFDTQNGESTFCMLGQNHLDLYLEMSVCITVLVVLHYNTG